jgi:hypothetical protein
VLSLRGKTVDREVVLAHLASIMDTEALDEIFAFKHV